MRPLQETRQRWKALFKGQSSISSLRAATTDGRGSEPCGVGLRSICWKLFLLFPELSPASWSRTLRSERVAFEELRRVHVTPFEKAEDFEGPDIDPLAEDASNPWEQFRKDEGLRKEIFQDVERCMPENAYFRDPEIQNSLLNILFIYCKLNEDVSYRQGMHEIVAVILWVISCDAITPGVSIDATVEQAYKDDSIMVETLDARYIEHDTFSLFQVVMRSAKAWYELGEEAGDAKDRGRSENRTSSPIVEKSKYIHEHLLMLVDPELAEHLKALDVLPQVFLIRWIRLLFGREFPFEELLEVWDMLFAEDPNLQLVDHICVAMLLRVRWQLMEADYSTALTLVLRYPSPSAPDLPATFVADAIYLRDNPTFAGGKRIVTKYSNRAPPAPRQKQKVPKLLRKNSPMNPPARFLQPGQLESIVQDVAKNMLSQGEKWGVNRAVRDAVVDLKKNVQGFQHNQQHQQQWAAQESAREAELVKRSRELSKRLKMDEERRTLLEKLLQLSIDELETENLSADKKKAALSRLRHVRACLSDSSKAVEPLHAQSSEVPSSPSSVRSPLFRSSSETSPSTRKAIQSSPPASAQMPRAPSSPQGTFVKTSFKNNSDPDFLTHRPRASLAQSSFAWMLGDDPAAKTKTAFVSPSNRANAPGGAGPDGLGVDGTWSSDADEGFDLRHLRRKR